MKKTLLVILALFLVVGVADAKHKRKKKVRQVASNGIQSVTMHRTACFGRCPDYSIEIDNKGALKYTGIHFVTDSGVHEKNIGAAEAKRIFDDFAKYKVDTCSNVYTNRIPDAPGLFFIIQYQGKKQTIGNAHFGPLFLKELAKEMDDKWNEVKVK